MKIHKLLLGLLLILSLALPCFAAPDPLDTAMDNLASQIVNSASKIKGNEKNRVAVIEFSDLQGNIPDLGKYIAEELTTRLVLTNQFEVVERTLLNKVMAEHKLSLSGLIDINSAKEIGKILGVAAIISGTITDLGDNVKVNARLINTETGAIAAVASVQLKKTQAIQRLLGGNNPQDSSSLPSTEPTPVMSAEEIKNAEYDKLIDLGSKYRSQDLTDKAIATFKKAVDLDPKQETAYQNLIEIYLKKPDYSQTLSWCQKAVAKIDDFAYAYAVMGYCYLNITPKSIDKAIEALNTAIAITEEPDSEGWTYYVLGMANKEKGQPAEAKASFEKALGYCRELNLQPAWSLDCSALLKAVDADLLKKAEKARKTDYDKLIDLGSKYKSQNLWDTALETFKKAADLDPKQEKAYQNLIEIYLRKKDYPQTLNWSQKAVAEINNFAYAYAAMGFCYINSTPKNIDKANEFLNKAIAITEYPDNEGWTYYALGMVYKEKGQFTEAKASLDKALKRCQKLTTKPDWSVACNALLKDVNVALSKNAEEERKTEYDRLMDLGGKYRSQDLLDSAIAAFKKAVELDPEQQKAYQNLIEIYLIKKDYPQTLSWCQRAVAEINNYAYANAVMGYCYLKTIPKSIDKALDSLNNAVSITEYPDTEGWTYYVLGMANKDKKQFFEAKVSFDKALNRCQELHIQPDWSVDCASLLKEVNIELAKKAEEAKKAEYDKLIASGIQCRNQGLMDQAVKFFEQAVDMDPKQEKAYQNLIAIYLEKPDYTQTLLWCQAAVAKISDFAYAYAAMGFCYLNSVPENTDKAIEVLSKAIAIDEYPTGDGWAYYILGRAYQEQGQLDNARLYLEKALKRSSTDWYQDCAALLEPILGNLITSSLNNQDYPQALSISQEALSLLNNYVWGYIVTGFCYMSITPHQPDNALTALNKAFAISEYPDNEGWAYYIQGMVYKEKGQSPEAKVSFDKALNRCRELNIQPQWSFDCNAKLKDLYPELIKKAIDSNSDQLFTLCQEAIAKYNLAYAYSGMGYYYLQANPPGVDQALESINAAINISEYPDDEGWTYYLLGRAYYEKGNKVEAKAALEKAITRYQSAHSSPVASAWYHKSLQMLNRLNQTNKICFAAGLGEYTQLNGISETVSLVEMHYGTELPLKFSRGLIAGVGFSDHVFLIKAGVEGALEIPMQRAENFSWSIPFGLGYYSATETVISYDYGTGDTITDYQTSSGFYTTVGAAIKYYINKQQGVRLTAGVDYFNGPENFDPLTFRASLIIPLANQ